MISGASRVMRFNAENFISRTMLHFTRHCFSTPVFLLLSGGSGIQTFYTVHKSSSSGCSSRCSSCHGAEIRREVRPVPPAFGFQGTPSFPLLLQKLDLSWIEEDGTFLHLPAHCFSWFQKWDGIAHLSHPASHLNVQGET